MPKSPLRDDPLSMSVMPMHHNYHHHHHHHHHCHDTTLQQQHADPARCVTDGERAPSLTPFSSAALLLCYRGPALLHLRRPVGHGFGPVPVRPAAGELPGDLVATDQYVPLFSVPRDRAHPIVLRPRQHVRLTGARRPTPRPPPSRQSASSWLPGGAGNTRQSSRPRRRDVRSSDRFTPVPNRCESVRGSCGDLASSRR